MITTFIVAYDISDPKRLAKVYKIMRGFGDHLQLSVFRCDLNKKELVKLKTILEKTIKHDEDQVLIVDVGPAEGRAGDAFEAIGRPYTHPERHAVVV